MYVFILVIYLLISFFFSLFFNEKKVGLDLTDLDLAWSYT